MASFHSESLSRISSSRTAHEKTLAGVSLSHACSSHRRLSRPHSLAFKLSAITNLLASVYESLSLVLGFEGLQIGGGCDCSWCWTCGWLRETRNSIFNNTGLFGIYASTSPEFVPKAVDLAAKELIAIASPGQVSQVQLDRAKKSTKSAVLMNLESRMIASKDIGRQILTYGERTSVEQFLKVVDEITLNDIT